MPITSPRATAIRGHAVTPLWDVKDPEQLAEWVRQLSDMIQQILNDGSTNAKGSVTLDANGTTTTLNDLRIGTDTKIMFSPTTENARAAGVPAVTTKGRKTATLTHTNTADTDKTYDYLIVN